MYVAAGSIPVRRIVLVTTLLAVGAMFPAPVVVSDADRPHVLLVTIDTLRADRMSGYGYHRETSPHLDRLMGAGVRFAQARTVEPLTAPALCSMVTSSNPHVHGSSRNGLRMRPGLDSLPHLLSENGYKTAAIVSNWTLRDKISGLAEHFDDYNEILKHKRWFGLVSGEADADDVTDEALGWLKGHFESGKDQPFLLWVHYVEPHAPYKLHKKHAAALGIKGKNASKSDRYDTEIVEVDRYVGELLRGLEKIDPETNTLVVFASDHGESLGEHDYWGHGRHLYEPTLHVPMSITWPGRIEPGTIESPALITDLAPTVAGLLGLASPPSFEGFDWTGVFAGAPEPANRITRYQAHKGAVLSNHDSDVARRAGLLEVAVVREGTKEILRVKSGRLWNFDLVEDPLELDNLAQNESAPTENLAEWTEVVASGLTAAEDIPPTVLDDETMAQLKALGYAE